MRISDWSSDVCSSDLGSRPLGMKHRRDPGLRRDDEIWKPCFSPTGSRSGSVIASEATQSRAVYAGSGLLRFARNDDGLGSAVRRDLAQHRRIIRSDRHHVMLARAAERGVVLRQAIAGHAHEQVMLGVIIHPIWSKNRTSVVSEKRMAVR